MPAPIPFGVSVVSLGGLLLWFAWRLTAREASSPNGTVPPDAHLTEALQRVVIRQMSSIDACEHMRHQLHDIKNMVAPLVLDLEGLDDVKREDRSAAWAELESEFVEMTRELSQLLEQVGRVDGPSTAVVLKDLFQRGASHRGPVSIDVDGDMQLAVHVEGGRTALDDLLLLLGTDVARHGGERLVVRVTSSPRRIKIFFSCEAKAQVFSEVTLAAAQAMTRQSQGDASLHALAAGAPLELVVDLPRAPSDRPAPSSAAPATLRSLDANP